MRWAGVSLVAVAALFLVGTLAPNARKFGNLESPALAEVHRTLTEQADYHAQTRTLPDGGQERLDQIRRDRRWVGYEMFRRTVGMDSWMPWLGAAGVFLIALSFLRRRRRGRKSTEALRSKSEAGEDIPDAIPREEYVDEWELLRRSEGGFRTREEAIRWILQDPALKCDYCGLALRSTFAGQREAVELVTFYKKVPDGAKDLRIVLGSFWYAKAATELQCTGCGRTLKR